MTGCSCPGDTRRQARRGNSPMRSGRGQLSLNGELIFGQRFEERWQAEHEASIYRSIEKRSGGGRLSVRLQIKLEWLQEYATTPELWADRARKLRRSADLLAAERNRIREPVPGCDERENQRGSRGRSRTRHAEDADADTIGFDAPSSLLKSSSAVTSLVLSRRVTRPTARNDSSTSLGRFVFTRRQRPRRYGRGGVDAPRGVHASSRILGIYVGRAVPWPA